MNPEDPTDPGPPERPPVPEAVRPQEEQTAVRPVWTGLPEAEASGEGLVDRPMDGEEPGGEVTDDGPGEGGTEEEIPPEKILQRVYLTYTEAIVRICGEVGLNPVIVAARIRQEHGAADSQLITGTYPFTLEDGTVINGGYYNYFNLSAYGNSMAEIYTSGLREAYENGWDTRYKALRGGAEKYHNIYISRGQTTQYTQKFSVDSSSESLFWGQYMQNLTAPIAEATTMYRSFAEAGALDADLTFVIPVFEDMPAENPMPVVDGNPNYKLGSISVNGERVSAFSEDIPDYAVTVDGTAKEATFSILSYAPETELTVTRFTDAGRKDIPVSKEVRVMGASTVAIHTLTARLPYGASEFRILSTAANGRSMTYSVTVTRPGTWDATLSGLLLDGTLLWGFDPDTLSYGLEVGPETEKVFLQAVPFHEAAAVTAAVNRNGAVMPLPLSTGGTGDNGGEDTDPSGEEPGGEDTDPSGEEPGGENTDPSAEEPGGENTAPSVEEPGADTNVRVTDRPRTGTGEDGEEQPGEGSGEDPADPPGDEPGGEPGGEPGEEIPEDPDTDPASRNPSGLTYTAEVPLSYGVNAVTFTVTAPDGQARTYTVAITRREPDDYRLFGLTLNGVSPEGFDPDITEYGFVQEAGVQTLTVSAVLRTPGSTVQFAYEHGDRTDPVESVKTEETREEDGGRTVYVHTGTLPVSYGVSRIRILVTALSGETRTYTVTVTRDRDYVYGDVNNDGAWNIFDVAQVRSHILGYQKLDGVMFLAADIDEDGVITIFDVAYLRSYILGYSASVKPAQTE
ncbi:MAG: cadherin-like beta sandwich domain-containing protein [Lachnospiraceae bacterium]|nr:cadherin-like beta sandwich domain-containing protein [Lachnospiraceae bacterium]